MWGILDHPDRFSINNYILDYPAYLQKNVLKRVAIKNIQQDNKKLKTS